MLLMGRSGCGKSTLLALLARLYQPEPTGHVEIFGDHINDVVMHERLLLMEQSPVVFAGTYRDNLTVGLDHEAADEELQRACVKAGTWNDVQELSKGLDSDVGFRGKLLSGGERQRLALARCLLRRVPMLLLDEPVSSQDKGAVDAIAEMLNEETVPVPGAGPKANGAPLTVLATTHNMSLLEHFSHVGYMSNGRIVESGPKAEVLARKGHVYRRLVSQAGLYVDKRGRAHVTMERLRQVWLFNNVPDDALQRVTTCFAARMLQAGEELFREGADADAMYLVVSGQIEMKRAAGIGGERARSHRTIWQAGDEIGVGGVVDTTMVWPGTAVVASMRAVLLELGQSDLETLIEDDAQLRESVGETIELLRRVRSPSHLAQLWCFYGAPFASLEAVGAALEPSVYDTGALLCDAPRDPCATLSLLVRGHVTAVRGGASRDDCLVERLGSGTVLGTAEVLPEPPVGSLASEIRRRQGVLQRVRSSEYTIALEMQVASALLSTPPSPRFALRLCTEALHSDSVHSHRLPHTTPHEPSLHTAD